MISLDVLRIPVDQTPSPINRALLALVCSGGPEGQLNPGWCLWIMVLIVRFVEGIGLVQDTGATTIHRPRQ